MHQERKSLNYINWRMETKIHLQYMPLEIVKIIEIIQFMNIYSCVSDKLKTFQAFFSRYSIHVVKFPIAHSAQSSMNCTYLNWVSVTNCMHWKWMLYAFKVRRHIRDHVFHCRGSQECGSRFVNLACQFHSRWHSLRITLKSTTSFMRSSHVWTTKPWQRS